MEPEPFPRAPAGLRIREFEVPALPRSSSRLMPLNSPSRVIVEVH